MAVVKPEAISPHLKGWNEVEDGRRRLFCFAMQSALARGGKKAGDGRCGRMIEAKPVSGQTHAFRGRRRCAPAGR
jgi:hypothetical protein